MSQEKYYMVITEEYDGRENPWRIEREGLFKSYRDASEWLTNNEFKPHTQKNPFDEEWELHFIVESYLGDELYLGYIEEWEVKHMVK